MTQKLKITVLGTGTSVGIPALGSLGWGKCDPNNKKNTGPLSKFTNMLKGKSYEMLINHLDHQIDKVQSDDLKVLFEVTILDSSKVYYKFNWQVEKYTGKGPLNDCWLTTIVSAPTPLGSSV